MNKWNIFVYIYTLDEAKPMMKNNRKANQLNNTHAIQVVY